MTVRPEPVEGPVRGFDKLSPNGGYASSMDSVTIVWLSNW
jgi:hypothetical protein